MLLFHVMYFGIGRFSFYSYATRIFTSALVSKGQISVCNICPILKPALYKYHIIIIIIMFIPCKCWSIVKPKKLNSVTCSIICSFIFNCGIRFSMFRCLWWKIMNFVFFTSNYNLFISNHVCMFFNSLFILTDNCILLQLLSIFTSNEHNVLVKFVSSANKMAWNFVLALWMSFI